MAFSVVSKKNGKTYYLHAKDVILRGGRKQTIYYFGGEAKAGAIDSLPAGCVVIESKKTGLPLLKRK